MDVRVGGPPIASGQPFQYTVIVQGRLADPEQFGDVIVRARDDGSGAVELVAEIGVGRRGEAFPLGLGRQPRSGRLRVDLGGLYFNAVFSLGAFAVWAATGWDPLLVLFVLQLLQMARQLAPLVRFDGYHILADLTGELETRDIGGPARRRRVEPARLLLQRGRRHRWRRRDF